MRFIMHNIYVYLRVLLVRPSLCLRDDLQSKHVVLYEIIKNIFFSKDQNISRFICESSRTPRSLIIHLFSLIFSCSQNTPITQMRIGILQVLAREYFRRIRWIGALIQRQQRRVQVSCDISICNMFSDFRVSLLKRPTVWRDSNLIQSHFSRTRKELRPIVSRWLYAT